MNKVLRFLTIFCSVMTISVMAGAVELSGAAHVNVTSDTAATAKNMAFNEARRQITTDVLSKYTDTYQFNELMSNTKDSDLTNLVLSTSIENERLSATTYSANIKMKLDNVSVKKWLDENEVQNWLGLDDLAAADKSIVMIDITGGLRDWIEIGHILRDDKISLDVKRIFGGVVTANIPSVSKTSFISAVRNVGWKYSESDGALRVWK